MNQNFEIKKYGVLINVLVLEAKVTAEFNKNRMLQLRHKDKL